MSRNESKYFLRVDQQSWASPNYIASSMADIDIEILKRLEIGCVILDIDDTLVRRRGNQVDDHIASHLKRIRRSGIKLVIGSNRKRDITQFAESINAVVVDQKKWHFKPMKYFFDHIIRSINLSPDKIVMVGDRIINDVIGANRVGIRTILVQPIKRKLGWVSRRYWVKIMQDTSLVDSRPVKK